jgi:hypothetical protein
MVLARQARSITIQERRRLDSALSNKIDKRILSLQLPDNYKNEPWADRP